VCAAYPGGEPNHVIDDLAAHLMLEHRTSNNDLISFLAVLELASCTQLRIVICFHSYILSSCSASMLLLLSGLLMANNLNGE